MASEDLRAAVERLVDAWDCNPDAYHVGTIHAAIVADLRALLAAHPDAPAEGRHIHGPATLCQIGCPANPTMRVPPPTRAKGGGESLVTHADPDEYARIWNIGYDAAVAQHLADDPTLADEWLARRERDAAARAWDEGHRFTGYAPERGENPYREEH